MRGNRPGPAEDRRGAVGRWRGPQSETGSEAAGGKRTMLRAGTRLDLDLRLSRSPGTGSPTRGKGHRLEPRRTPVVSRLRHAPGSVDDITQDVYLPPLCCGGLEVLKSRQMIDGE